MGVKTQLTSEAQTGIGLNRVLLGYSWQDLWFFKTFSPGSSSLNHYRSSDDQPNKNHSLLSKPKEVLHA